MRKSNSSEPACSGEPDHAFVTYPGCYTLAHRERIFALTVLTHSVPGYVPEPEVMPCGCCLEVVPWPTRSAAEGRQ